MSFQLFFSSCSFPRRSIVLQSPPILQVQCHKSHSSYNASDGNICRNRFLYGRMIGSFAMVEGGSGLMDVPTEALKAAVLVVALSVVCLIDSYQGGWLGPKVHNKLDQTWHQQHQRHGASTIHPTYLFKVLLKSVKERKMWWHTTPSAWGTLHEHVGGSAVKSMSRRCFSKPQ